jgi:hypothetical protein
MSKHKTVNGIPEIVLIGLYEPAEETEWEHRPHIAATLATRANREDVSNDNGKETQ